jgi:hypothetical protein
MFGEERRRPKRSGATSTGSERCFLWSAADSRLGLGPPRHGPWMGSMAALARAHIWAQKRAAPPRRHRARASAAAQAQSRRPDRVRPEIASLSEHWQRDVRQMADAEIRLISDRKTLCTSLVDHGYRADATTRFVWEGVTQYLTEPAVRAVFEVLANAPTGSRLAFSYVCQDFLDGTDFHGSKQDYRRFVATQIWRFGLHPVDVPDLLAEYGWREREQVGADEYITRYLVPAGRTITITGLERSVSAEKS